MDCQGRFRNLTPVPDARFPVAIVQGVPVVTAPGEIDTTSASGLRAALIEAASLGRGAAVVDLSGTTFCDTWGTHVLVAAHKRAA